jgi:hypothetical protein
LRALSSVNSKSTWITVTVFTSGTVVLFICLTGTLSCNKNCDLIFSSLKPITGLLVVWICGIALNFATGIAC